MEPRTLVIVNPRSSNGATGRRWARVEATLRDSLGDLEVVRTRAPRDAERIAREAVLDGVERLVVAGGDGTLSEIVTGLLAADLAQRAEIGVLPLGSGGDFMRTLGIPPRPDDAIAALAGGKTRRLDAGRATYTLDSGRVATSYFLNIASLGVSALITRFVNATGKGMGGRAAFLMGSIRGILGFNPEPLSVRVDGEIVHEGPTVLATVANGRWFGGGMHVAPQARPDDAELDIVIIGALTKLQLLRRLPLLYSGTHLDDPAVASFRGRRVEFEAAPGTVHIEVDGEPLGSAPVEIEVLPGAVDVLGPGPEAPHSA